jgi:acetyl-CoA C-acetyltransferase
MKSAYIVAAKRTPIGAFMGKLLKTKGPKLGSISIRGAIDQIGIDPRLIDEVLLGTVIGSGQGQNPARQASLGAGIPLDVPCTLINKVCSSGMKTVTLAATTIEAGRNNVVVAGGFESMSNAPFYVMNHRKGVPFGNQQFLDAIAYDGLTDAYNNCAMGVCAEKTAEEMAITR